MDHQGRRVVEKKELTKAKIGRSPDDADAVHLAFLESRLFEPSSAAMPASPPSLEERMNARESTQSRRGLFGRGS
jgi:hypothetical protein